MEEKDLWIKKMKEKVENYSEQLPLSAWERIEKDLIPPSKKTIYPFRRWIAATAAVILLAVVSTVSLYLLDKTGAERMRQLPSPSIATIPDILPAPQQPDVQGIPASPVHQPATRRPSLLARIDKEKAQSHTPAEEEQTNITASQQENRKQHNLPVEYESYQDSKEQQNDSSNPTKKSEKKVYQPNNYRNNQQFPPRKHSSQKGRWSVGLSVGNAGGMMADANSQSHHSMEPVAMPSASNPLVEIPNDQTVFIENGIPYLNPVKQVVDVKHRQPISFGLSVRKELMNHFSIETGITYTLLSSDITLSDSDRPIQQKLHYVGIPLRGNWSFLHKQFFTLYVSGGGTIEKCVYGKSGSEKETVKPLQFSLLGAVGAQVNATKHVGIYIEPGIGYYFNDGSSMQTIRKESPLNFNLQAGIRLSY